METDEIASDIIQPLAMGHNDIAYLFGSGPASYDGSMMDIFMVKNGFDRISYCTRRVADIIFLGNRLRALLDINASCLAFKSTILSHNIL